jgi:hypothetical protein
MPKLVLEGILTLGGKRVALTEQAAIRPGERPSDPTHLYLAEGETAGDIEVLRIDETAGAVLVKCQGAEMKLTFEKDGATLSPQPPQSANQPVAVSSAGNPVQATGRARIQLNAEEAALAIEVERQRLKNERNSLSNLMPPTELTPGAQQIRMGQGSSPRAER